MATIEERYRKQHPKSAQLYERAKAHFPDGVTHETRYFLPFSLYVTHGKGSHKWDVDGNEYVDYVSGHGSLLLGHGRPEVVKAVQEQMARATHPGASTELEIRWAELIKKLIPSAQKVRFVASGTEASMMVMRMARAYTGKNKIIKFQDHFHGWQDYAVAGSSGTSAGIPAATWSSVIVLQPDIGQVEKTLKEDKDVAAVILEPTGANMGFLPIKPTFLSELRELTKKYGVLLIFDEVVQGFRASPGGAQGRFGITPDLTMLAKILAGGLPGGAVVGKADIIDMLAHRGDPEWDAKKRIIHQGTFNANPLSASAGVAALTLISTQPINATADATAKKIRDGLNGLLKKMEIPGCAAGLASIVHLYLGRNLNPDMDMYAIAYEEIKSGMKPPVPGTLRRALLNEGADIIRGVTMLVSSAHTDAEVGKTLAAYEAAFAAMRKENVLP